MKQNSSKEQWKERNSYVLALMEMVMLWIIFSVSGTAISEHSQQESNQYELPSSDALPLRLVGSKVVKYTKIIPARQN